MTDPKQRARIDAAGVSAVHVAAREALLRQAREDVSTLAWRSVQRITPEVAAQEPQSIAEMIAHLQAMQIAALSPADGGE